MNGRPASRFEAWGSPALSVRVISLVLSINLVVLCAPSQAAESPPGPTPNERAKQHYLKGEAYFKAHDFSAAMGEYQSGYEEKADPVFIFNIAQCQRLLGHPGPALESYRRYLRESPDGAGRAVAERQIAELEALTGSEEATPSATPVVPPPIATTVLGTPPPTASPGVASGGPSVEVEPTASKPSALPRAAGSEPLAASSSSAARSESPPVKMRSLTAVDATSPSVGTSPALTLHGDQEPARPIYRRWWFWAAAGALSIAAIVAISAASSGGKPACDADRICR
jgi:hypothetical protein